MTLALLPPWLLGAAAALALAGAALGPSAVRLPLLAAAAGAATVALSRRRPGAGAPPRLQLVSRVALGPKAHASLLSVDGATWLVVVGDGCAQLTRTNTEEKR